MKILLINYRYYESAGPERYLFNIKSVLESHGHEVIIFSSDYMKNNPSEYQSYFSRPPGGDENFRFKDVKKNPISIIDLFSRQFFSFHVYNKVDALIKKTRPDVAYVFHFLRKLSPSVIDACHRNNVPVVVRLSDYALICPKNIFYREGKVCELCQKNLLYSIRHSCVQDSMALSFLNYFAYNFHYIRGVQHKINAFVCPSLFMAERFQANKWFKDIPAIHIPTFVDPELLKLGQEYPPGKVRNVIMYWGRISTDKGIAVVLEAMKKLKRTGISCSLKLIGDGEPEFVKWVNSYIMNESLSNIEVIPFLQKDKLFDLVRRADVALVPSVWYDNMPNSLLEAQSLGIPVIASDIGSFPEMIKDGHNGFLFEPNNSDSLCDVITKIFQDKGMLDNMRANSYQWAAEHYSPEVHYQKLMNIFQKVT